jgi:hypothetical protein
MKSSLKALMLPLLLTLPIAAPAQEREWVPYKKLIETIKLDKFYAPPAVNLSQRPLGGELESD